MSLFNCDFGSGSSEISIISVGGVTIMPSYSMTSAVYYFTDDTQYGLRSNPEPVPPKKVDRAVYEEEIDHTTTERYLEI